MSPSTSLSPAARRAALGFGTLGGGVAWLFHLLLAYVIAEFGCLSGLGKTRLLGISAVAWLVIVMSAAVLAAAVAATVVAYRHERQLRASLEGDAAGQADLHLAHLGWITSAVFAFIILVETAPIFYFLKEC